MQPPQQRRANAAGIITSYHIPSHPFSSRISNSATEREGDRGEADRSESLATLAFMIGFMLRLSCIVVNGDVTCWNNTTGLSLRPIYAMTCGVLSLVA